MILTGKLPIIAIPVVLAAAWPFTSTETILLMTSASGMVVAIIGALKADSAKKEAGAAKLAVNGHLAKLEKEQDKAKSDRDMEFNRLLQVVKDASRAEGAEIARKEAELLATKLAAASAPVVLQASKMVTLDTAMALAKAASGEALLQPTPVPPTFQ